MSEVIPKNRIACRPQFPLSPSSLDNPLPWTSPWTTSAENSLNLQGQLCTVLAQRASVCVLVVVVVVCEFFVTSDIAFNLVDST